MKAVVHAVSRAPPREVILALLCKRSRGSFRAQDPANKTPPRQPAATSTQSSNGKSSD